MSVEPYLRAGSPAQRRLLAAMAAGHGLEKHGTELGSPTAARYRRVVVKHVRRATVGYEVTGGDGRPRYLIADPKRGRVAWLTPHREHRSTYFAPKQGVEVYVRRLRTAAPGERWRPLDLTEVRAGPTRTATRTIASAQRHPPGPGRSLG